MSEPEFSRRRRRRVAAVVSACLAAAAALGVAIPVALAGSGSPGTVLHLPVVRLPPTAVRVNGRGPSETFAVAPGQHLSMNVTMTVPARARITAFWLGISSGTYGAGETGPVGMYPILAHTRKVLDPGCYTYQLTWTAPTGLRRPSMLWLAGAWTGVLPEAGPPGSHWVTDAAIAGPIAKLVLSR